MDRNVMIERLAWLANAPRGEQADWLPPNDWCRGIAEVATAALLAIPQWLPLNEAPIPPADTVPSHWRFQCLLQNARGWVGEGCARYVVLNGKGNVRSPTLRWYMTVGHETLCQDPLYYQPLPQPRKD